MQTPYCKQDTIVQISIDRVRALAYGASKEKQCREASKGKDKEIRLLQDKIINLEITLQKKEKEVQSMEAAKDFSEEIVDEYKKEVHRLKKEIKKLKMKIWIIGVGSGIITVLIIIAAI